MGYISYRYRMCRVTTFVLLREFRDVLVLLLLLHSLGQVNPAVEAELFARHEHHPSHALGGAAAGG